MNKDCLCVGGQLADTCCSRHHMQQIAPVFVILSLALHVPLCL